MKFDIDCSILVQVYGVEEGDDSPTIVIHGFYRSSELARGQIEPLKAQLAEKWAAGINHFFGAEIWQPAEYRAGRFFVIRLPLSEFKTLLDLEDAIEAAALAAWRKQAMAAAAV